MLEKIEYPPHKPSQREFRTVEVFILLENVFHERLSNFNPNAARLKSNKLSLNKVGTNHLPPPRGHYSPKWCAEDIAEL